jgi:hypothetical protein
VGARDGRTQSARACLFFFPSPQTHPPKNLKFLSLISPVSLNQLVSELLLLLLLFMCFLFLFCVYFHFYIFVYLKKEANT